MPCSVAARKKLAVEVMFCWNTNLVFEVVVKRRLLKQVMF
jgi:hypothetical protein